MAGALLKDQLAADKSMLAEKKPAAPGINPAVLSVVPESGTTMVAPIEYKVVLEDGLESTVPAQRPFDLVAGERHFGSSLESAMSLEQIIWLCWRALSRHDDPRFRTDLNGDFDAWAETVVDIRINKDSVDPLADPEAEDQTS